MVKKTWKKVERRIAREFGTTRTPLSGISSKHTQSDTLHDKLFIEIKYRQKIPFYKIYKETIEKAKKEGKIPLVIFVEKHSEKPIVMCSLKDIKDIAIHTQKEGADAEHKIA